jgi:hypothetical protein
MEQIENDYETFDLTSNMPILLNAPVKKQNLSH